MVANQSSCKNCSKPSPVLDTENLSPIFTISSFTSSFQNLQNDPRLSKSYRFVLNFLQDLYRLPNVSTHAV